MTRNRKSQKSDGISMDLLTSKDSSDSGVICKTPAGFFRSFRFGPCGASPCQRVTGIAASSHTSERRPNWSLISAFNGAMYKAPTLFGGSSSSSVRIGKNAASVFPDAVEAHRSTWSSVPKIASPAAFCTPRSACQPER